MHASKRLSMHPNLRRCVLGFSALVFSVIVISVGRASAQAPPPAPGPRVVVNRTASPAGPVDVVRLEGWPSGAVDISVCGNGARRGSQDCDPRGTRTVDIRADGTAETAIDLVPPLGCPCAVRASSLGGAVTVVEPVVIPGVATLPADQLPAPAVPSVPASHHPVEGRDGGLGAELSFRAGVANRLWVLGLLLAAMAMTAFTIVLARVHRRRRHRTDALA